MSPLTLKSVVWYCQRYTKRFYVQPDDRWTLHGCLNRVSDTMFENDISLGYSQALDIAVRVWAFAQWFASNRKIADIPRLEQMCLSGVWSGVFPATEEKWLVGEMAKLVSSLDGKEDMQLSYLNKLLSLTTHTVASVIEREAPGFFHPERVLAKYCADHLNTHNDGTRARMWWCELDDILCHGKWISKDQALRLAIESWCVSQSELYANVDELEEIATRPTIITDHYLSQNDAERLLDPAHHLLYSVRFGVNRELAMDFLTRSMKVCADSLLLTYPEMFNNGKVGN